MYVRFLLNHIHSAGINGILITKSTGSTVEIRSLLRFRFWQPVYYKVDESNFPSDISETFRQWVGISEHVGHNTTFKVLNDDTQKILFRSNLRSDEKIMESNLRLDPPCREPYPFVESRLYRDKQSVSRLYDSSVEDEEDDTFPMDKNLPKDETSDKTG